MVLDDKDYLFFLKTKGAFLNNKNLTSFFGEYDFFKICYNNTPNIDFEPQKSLILPSKRAIVRDVSGVFSDLRIDLRDVVCFKKSDACLKSPFSIPIKFIYSRPQGTFNSSVFTATFGLDFKNMLIQKYNLPEEEIIKLDDYFNRTIPDSVVISRCDRKTATLVYAHEIFHTQVSENLGNCLSVNSETLPIFAERLVTRKLPKISVVGESFRKFRIQDAMDNAYDMLVGDLSEEDFENAEVYFVSTFQGLYLDFLFANSNSAIQKEIISKLNSVIKLECTLEEFMDKFDTSIDRIPMKFKKRCFNI